jgi:hypothetical protein
MLGFALGGFVPLASYVVAHYEIDPAVAVYQQITTLLVLGGLLYSGKTVYAWGKLALRAPLVSGSRDAPSISCAGQASARRCGAIGMRHRCNMTLSR